jgi:voltage-gated potassium channel Kch
MAATVNSDNVRATSVVMHRYLRTSVLEKKRASLDRWQDRVRDPSLTVLLVLQLFLLFVALPLAATGVPIAAPVAWLLLLVAVTLVVLLSQRGVAIVIILLGLACAAASFAFGRQWSPITASVLNHGGFILAFSALTWVVAHALYAPGRITFHRLQGAAVVYLSLATIFANAFGLVWQLVPGAFANLAPAAPSASEFATMLYFSLATLTTTGYGDIVPLNPFARSLASLESVIGPFYLAITVARLVTMELDDRRRSRQ